MRGNEHLKQEFDRPRDNQKDITMRDENIKTIPLCPILSEMIPNSGAIIATAKVGIA